MSKKKLSKIFPCINLFSIRLGSISFSNEEGIFFIYLNIFFLKKYIPPLINFPFFLKNIFFLLMIVHLIYDYCSNDLFLSKQ